MMSESRRMTKPEESISPNNEENVLSVEELEQVSVGINLWEIDPEDTTDIGDDTKDKI